LSRTEDFLDFVSIIKPPYISPHCADYVDLEFSIHAFEHLEVSFQGICNNDVAGDDKDDDSNE